MEVMVTPEGAQLLCGRGGQWRHWAQRFSSLNVTYIHSVLSAARSLWQGADLSEPQFLHLQSGVIALPRQLV